MTTTTEEIPQLLKNLRLRKMAATIENELQAARKSSPSYSDFLVRLLRAEWLNQQERKLQARIHRAHLPELWTLESFPFKKARKLPKNLPAVKLYDHGIITMIA